MLKTNKTKRIIGDRVVIQSLPMDSGMIMVKMLTQSPDDSMAKPTLEVTHGFRLDKYDLISVYKIFKGALE